MSSPLDHLNNQVAEAGAEACWRQWAELGFAGAGTVRPELRSIIDPEALLLFSLVCRPHEPRLEDAVRWWARVGSPFLSTQRTSSMLLHGFESARPGLREFASAALLAGDHRWSRMAEMAIEPDQPNVDAGSPWSTRAKAARPRRQKGPELPNLSAPAALQLRLRAGLSVGAKSDLLTYLLGHNTGGATISEVSDSLLYTARGLRDVAAEMALAGFVRVSRTRPARYYAIPTDWPAFLSRTGPHANPVMPGWRNWAAIYGLMTAVLQFGRSSLSKSAAPIVLAARAQEILAEYDAQLLGVGIVSEPPSRYRGEDYLRSFTRTIEGVVVWTRENL